MPLQLSICQVVGHACDPSYIAYSGSVPWLGDSPSIVLFGWSEYSITVSAYMSAPALINRELRCAGTLLQINNVLFSSHDLANAGCSCTKYRPGRCWVRASLHTDAMCIRALAMRISLALSLSSLPILTQLIFIRMLRSRHITENICTRGSLSMINVSASWRMPSWLKSNH